MSGLLDDIKDLITYDQTNKDFRVEDLSEQFIIYAVQGPGSLKVLDELIDDEILWSLSYFSSSEFHINRLLYFSVDWGMKKVRVLNNFIYREIVLNFRDLV